MVIVLNHNISDAEKQHVRDFLETKGFRIREIVGEEETIFGAVGLLNLDIREVEILSGVDRVIPISKPYKLASREFKKEDTVVPVGPVKIGGLRIVVIAGPCAVESKEQIRESARIVRESGAVMLRGGAFKPRTSPYAFQGLGEEGLKLLKDAGEAEGLPVVTEVVGTEYAEMMCDYIDMFQIGARNMQNFELLKKVAPLGKPVLLKRGFAATIEDWLMAAEYLLAHGNEHVILCERGIRTFETYTRNTLDISAIPVVKKLSHLPVMVDPSHATGIRDKVPPMALAAIAAGADGILVEVHPDPENAASDGAQSLYPEQFEKVMRDIEVLSPVVGKEVARLPAKKAHLSVAEANLKFQAADAGDATVAFQGEPGAYSEQAIKRFFGVGNPSTVPCAGFKDVFESVLVGESTYGVVPIENSLAGSIHENYDLLLQYPDIAIVGEKKIRIIHHLIGYPDTKIEEIDKVYSHPQGLAQCREFLDKYPHMERIPFYDTAGSVAYIAQENLRNCGAIASGEAAKVYNLAVLKEGIETNPRNYTRFFVLARQESGYSERANMASFVFSTPDKPGALFRCLQILADAKLNMKKLESRPIPGKPWEYMFYVDVEIPPENEVFDGVVENLKKETADFRTLGVYES